MTNQLPKQSQGSKNAINSKLPNKARPLPKSEGDTPIAKFNNAMRKILSVSKKDLKQK
jgi:hypothetical protein